MVLCLLLAFGGRFLLGVLSCFGGFWRWASCFVFWCWCFGRFFALGVVLGAFATMSLFLVCVCCSLLLPVSWESLELVIQLSKKKKGGFSFSFKKINPSES